MGSVQLPSKNSFLLESSFNSYSFSADNIACSSCEKESDLFFNLRGCSDSYYCSKCFSEKSFSIFTNMLSESSFVRCRIVGCPNFKVNPNKKREKIGLAKRYQILKKNNFKCASCGISASDSLIEIDHINPICNGGGNGIENLQALCFDCNRGKGGGI